MGIIDLRNAERKRDREMNKMSNRNGRGRLNQGRNCDAKARSARIGGGRGRRRAGGRRFGRGFGKRR